MMHAIQLLNVKFNATLTCLSYTLHISVFVTGALHVFIYIVCTVIVGMVIPPGLPPISHTIRCSSQERIDIFVVEGW